MTGLTVAEIAQKTRQPRDVLADVLADEVKRGHVVKVGKRYRLSPTFDEAFGQLLRGDLNPMRAAA